MCAEPAYRSGKHAPAPRPGNIWATSQTLLRGLVKSIFCLVKRTKPTSSGPRHGKWTWGSPGETLESSNMTYPVSSYSILGQIWVVISYWDVARYARLLRQEEEEGTAGASPRRLLLCRVLDCECSFEPLYWVHSSVSPLLSIPEAQDTLVNAPVGISTREKYTTPPISSYWPSEGRSYLFFLKLTM